MGGAVTIRVQLLLALWGRIIDSGRVRTILIDVLTEQEWHEVVHRVGWVNLFSPEMPDGQYFFDLQYDDHRKMVQILVDLMSNEAGELLWSEEVFQHSADAECFSGQQMRAMRGRWQMSPESVPRAGLFNMRYCSDEQKGCVVNEEYRR